MEVLNAASAKDGGKGELWVGAKESLNEAFVCVSSTQELFGVILSNIYSRTFSKSFGESWEWLGQQGWEAAVPNYKVDYLESNGQGEGQSEESDLPLAGCEK